MDSEIDYTALAKHIDTPAGEPQAAIRLDFIPLSKLLVDPRYQRKVSSASMGRIRKIVRNFSWPRFGAIIVSKNGDGYSVIDGQHRTIAARTMGVASVPAVISEGDVVSQAKDFVGVNTVRTTVATIDKFRAAVTAGDPVAVEVSELLTELKISTDVAAGAGLQHKETRAVTVLTKMVGQFGKGEVFTALELMLDAQPGQRNLLTAFAIEAVTLTVNRVISNQGDIDRLLRVVENTDFETLQDEAKTQVKLTGGNIRHRGHERLLQSYNKGLQKRIE